MVFIFIGRGGRTPSKSGYKRTLQLRSNLIRITEDQTGLTGRPDRLDRSVFGNANFGCQQDGNRTCGCWYENFPTDIVSSSTWNESGRGLIPNFIGGYGAYWTAGIYKSLIAQPYIIRFSQVYGVGLHWGAPGLLLPRNSIKIGGG